MGGKSKMSNSYEIIGLLEGLTLIFASGKVFGFIDWSWWWVFSPVLIPLVIVLLIFTVIGTFILIKALIEVFD